MGFAAWLEQKYSTIDCLNDIWGRCYSTFSQIEAPLHSGAVNDFIDWREFHLDTMTEEARWRLQTVRQYDGLHPAYLHVVPNTMKPFNSITCVDDFALAPLCDVFAATMNDGPVFASQVVSAGRGRVCYNVESHLNFGGTGLHPRRVDHEDVRRDFLTQIGFGVRGFLMWQFRPESLGLESPAWGMIAGDGGDLPVTVALRDFWSKIGPLAGQFMSAMPVRARVGIWKSRRNECFHFAMHGSLDQLIESVEGYIRNLYWHNIPFRIVSENMLATGDLDDLAVLILPSPYHMTLDEACALDEWVRGGGVALCEAHLAGYNGTTGRHEWKMPGCGLADSWGMRESWTTSSHHLNLGQGDAFDQDVSEDVRKAMQEWQASGGRFFPMSLADGRMILGATRFAVIEGDGLAVDATFGDGSGEVMIATKPLGRGWIVYCGCHLGETAQKDERGLMTMLATWLIWIESPLSKAWLTPVEFT